MDLNRRLLLEQNQNGNDWVIPDIHACLNTLKDLLQKVSPAKNDRILFLGDLVNKGPDSSGVLDYLIELGSNFQIHLCIGNHDLILLNQNKNIIDYLIYKSFYQKACYFIEMEKVLLVHAGFNFSIDEPFHDTNPMISIRDFAVDRYKSKGKTVIHGHFPRDLKSIKESIETNNIKIGLDNGCVYPHRAGQGNLLALNLKNRELLKVSNSDIRLN